jgi:hypothetical protein
MSILSVWGFNTIPIKVSAGCCMSIVPALSRQRQENHKFEANLAYTVRLSQSNNSRLSTGMVMEINS